MRQERFVCDCCGDVIEPGDRVLPELLTDNGVTIAARVDNLDCRGDTDLCRTCLSRFLDKMARDVDRKVVSDGEGCGEAAATYEDLHGEGPSQTTKDIIEDVIRARFGDDVNIDYHSVESLGEGVTVGVADISPHWMPEDFDIEQFRMTPEQMADLKEEWDRCEPAPEELPEPQMRASGIVKRAIPAGVITEYHIDMDDNPAGGIATATGIQIEYQNGPMRDADGNLLKKNGAFVEDLIWLTIDRLNFFQQSKFKCRENAEAILLLTAALNALQRRTDRRTIEGTEGTHEV